MSSGNCTLGIEKRPRLPVPFKETVKRIEQTARLKVIAIKRL